MELKLWQELETKWVQQELICCGKPSCKKCGGKARVHGPYWYGYYTSDGKQKSYYIGKELPQELHNLAAAFGRGPLMIGREVDLPGQLTLEDVQAGQEEGLLTFTVIDAANTMGLPWPCTREKARKRVYNQLQAKTRSAEEKERIKAGWQRLCEFAGWRAD